MYSLFFFAISDFCLLLTGCISVFLYICAVYRQFNIIILLIPDDMFEDVHGPEEPLLVPHLDQFHHSEVLREYLYCVKCELAFFE